MRVKLWTMALSVVLAAACDPVSQPQQAPAGDDLAMCADARAEAGARRAACERVLQDQTLAPDARAQALSARGELKRLAGDPTGALADFGAALGLDANSNAAQLGRAEVLLDSGQLDAAEALLVAVVGRGEGSGRAHYLLGRLRARQGDLAAARASLDEAISADDANAAAFAARGRVRQMLDDDAGAREDFDAALRLDRANAEALAGRCWSRVRQSGDLAAALADADAAIAVDVRQREAQLCSGLIQLRREDWNAARAAYEAVLLNDPANADALYGRGFARRQLGERNEGREDIRRAFRIDSSVDRRFARFGVDD